VFGGIYRSFSPEYIAGEMKHLVKDFGARDIAFVDSTFTFTRERTLQVVKKVKEANLGVSWTCSVRADILDKSLLKEMKDSGCWRVRIGVESGSSEVLKFIKKGITRSQIRRAAIWAYELDLEPKAFFMLGHLNDTKETIAQTVDFALGLPLKDITVQINTPLKNTPQYELADRFGDWLTNDVSRSSFWEAVFIPKGLSYKELSQYHRKFYLRFYLRPQIWFRHIIKIRSFIDVIKYLRGTVVLAFMCYIWLKKKL
ncbi:MAG: radical SAM protein, partial [Candidatus Omnitrophica bacterium]|nr:radical SAM protein [Candidatus Omnitrophota bacterium]